MDDYKNFRYDYFGEFSSQEEPLPPKLVSKGNSRNESTAVVDDSLMDFIAQYFQGDVANDFSTCEESSQQTPERMVVDSPKSVTPHPFDSSAGSSADMSTSIELFTTPEKSTLSSSSDCLSIKSRKEEERTSRRKSISYEIRFTNAKDEDGRVKLRIYPNVRGSLGYPPMDIKNSIDPVSSKKAMTESEGLRYENALLHDKVNVLQRKLTCIEKESEKVVNELKRIIERKNEAISQLELQLAGIQFMEDGNK